MPASAAGFRVRAFEGWHAKCLGEQHIGCYNNDSMPHSNQKGSLVFSTFVVLQHCCHTVPHCSSSQVLYKLRVPNPDRMIVVRQAFEEGLSVDELYEMTKIDKWWLEQMKELYDVQVGTAGQGWGRGGRAGLCGKGRGVGLDAYMGWRPVYVKQGDGVARIACAA